MMNQDQYHSAQSDKVFYGNHAKLYCVKMLYCYTSNILFILFTSGQIKLIRQ